MTAVWSLTRSTLRAHRAGLAGTVVVLVLAGAVLAAMGVLVESGLRGGVLPDRYRDLDVVVTARGASAHSGAGVPRAARQRIERVPGAGRSATESTVDLTTAGGAVVAAHDWPLEQLAGSGRLRGRAPRRAGEVVLDRSLASALHARAGSRVRLADGGAAATYTVIGVVDHAPAAGRAASAYLSRTDLHRLLPATRTASAVVAVDAAPGTSARELAQRVERAVPGVVARTGDARGRAEFADAGAAGSSLLELTASLAGTAAIIVVFVVASTTGLSVGGRRRQFALLRALGATPGQLRAAVVREVLVLAAVAAPVGAVPGLLLGRLLRGPLVAAGVIPADYGLVLSPLPVLGALAVLAPVAVGAGLLTARQVTRLAPADALRRSAVEQPQVGRGRRVAAAVVAVLALGATLSPVFLPGPLGAASAGSSALLLLVAAALAGPPLVAAATGALARAVGGSRSAAVHLAVASSRASSRRLTAVVVPLAMTLCLGVVQISVNGLLARSQADQLRASTRADLVVRGAAGVAPAVVRELAAAPGVTAAAALSSTGVSITTSGEDGETTPGTAVAASPRLARSLLDPQVTKGSLAALADPGTVAVSEELASEEFLGVGDTVRVRHGATAQRARVVAVYATSGLGDVLVSPAALRSLVRGDLAGAPAADDVLLATTPASRGAVRERAAALGLRVVGRDAFVAERVDSAARLQQLSSLLVLALLVFVLLGAGNSLVMATAARRGEFDLLRTVGAGRRQLLAAAGVEALVVAAAAVVMGTLTLVPAIGGVLAGLRTATLPASAWAVHGALDAAVLAVAVVGAVGTTAVLTRRPGRS